MNMTNGVWQPEASNWTYCDPDKNTEDQPWSEGTKTISALCPMEWAREINKLSCAYAWKDYDPERDYSQDFFEAVTGETNGFLVQKLIAMSGTRMAAILNQIYDPPVPVAGQNTRIYGTEGMPERAKQFRFVKQG